MRQYPEYTESGVNEVGSIPAHWQLVTIKKGFRVVGGSTPSSGEPDFWDGSVVWVTPADLSRLHSREVTTSIRKITEEGVESCGTTVVPAGSLILSTRAPIGSLGIAGADLCTNQGCKALVPSAKVDTAFYYFYLSVSAEALNVRGRGTTFLELSGDALASFPVPLPPLAEQQAIAAFLDRETGKIDALVEEQRRLIALLKEKRQAVISHAVTKGLDPTAPLKPSGIDWLGDIPAHWEVTRLKRISPEITVGIVVEPSKYYVDVGIPALRSLNVRAGRIEQDNLVFISKDANEILTKSKLVAGDLVAVRTGQPGTCAVVPAELDGCNCIDLIIIRQSAAFDSDYLCWFMSSDVSLRQFAEGSGGAIQQHFNVSMAQQFVVAKPPVEEQSRILSFLDEETKKIDTLTAEATRAIVLLQERRTALISAAVTGKIDVRDALSNDEEAA